MKIDVLGTEYTIEELSQTECEFLEQCDGFCDKTSKRIVITTKPKRCELDDFETYRKQCLRHEIIHAFLFESGLANNLKHTEWGHDETMVDWVALQFPKLMKAFEEADAL